jgi:hypothetical protein
MLDEMLSWASLGCDPGSSASSAHPVKLKEDQMVRLYIRHAVTDYEAWRKAYDAFDPERRSMGVVGDAVYRAVGDPNDVTVWHDFDTKEAAEAFTTSDRLREVMTGAGVKGQPEVWTVAEARAGTPAVGG